MSNIWDYMKPSKPAAPQPLGVEITADRRMVIRWDDGTTTAVRLRTLRQECPCAACVDEWTHQRTFDPDKIAADTATREVGPVGSYALSIHFSDGHDTGIFDWELLRKLSEAVPA